MRKQQSEQTRVAVTCEACRDLIKDFLWHKMNFLRILCAFSVCKKSYRHQLCMPSTSPHTGGAQTRFPRSPVLAPSGRFANDWQFEGITIERNRPLHVMNVMDDHQV